LLLIKRRVWDAVMELHIKIPLDEGPNIAEIYAILYFVIVNLD
jgi:hypothetical protein